MQILKFIRIYYLIYLPIKCQFWSYNAVVSNLISLEQLIVDRNLVINSSFQTNGTIGLRWQVNDGLAVEAYGSTAATLLDAGQLFRSNQFRWGSRLILSF